MPPASTLRPDPRGHPPLDLVRGQAPAPPDIVEPAVHFLPDVQMVLDVFQRAVVRQAFNQLP